MASPGSSNTGRDQKEEYVQKRMEDMKKRSEEILRRHLEVEADKRNADMMSDIASTKIQVTVPHSQPSAKTVKNVKNTSRIQKEIPSELLATKKKLITEKVRRHISEEDSHSTTEKPRTRRQISDEIVPPRRMESEFRKQRFNEDSGPPPDPVNYLSDPYRDGFTSEAVDRNQDSRRHRTNYGGENFHNVKPIMQQRRNFERQNPAPPSSNSHLSMSVQMTGKERKEYENWKAERLKIDEERIARQKTSMGTWKREWDVNKIISQGTAEKKTEKQFYKEPRWLSESGDHQEQNEKKNQVYRGRFNPNVDYRPDEKGDRSVVVNENNTLTIFRSAECDAEQELAQKNQGIKKAFGQKDTGWKQDDRKVSKGDSWEDVDVSASNGVKWVDDLPPKKDVHALQQAKSTDLEWRNETKFIQKKNDSLHETRGNVDNRYCKVEKGNFNTDFRDNLVLRRQKSSNTDEFCEGNTRQDKRYSDKALHTSDSWEEGRENRWKNYREDWKDNAGWGNKTRNGKGQKPFDGWENDGGWKKPNTRGRIVSDGWENEEGWKKGRDNQQRRSSTGTDENKYFDNSYKNKYASSEKSRGDSFRGRIYSSDERDNPNLEGRKHENNSQRRVFSSSDNWQSRGNGNKRFLESDSHNFEKKWIHEESDQRRGGGGRNRFWEGSKRGSQRRIGRGHSNQEYKNTYETSRNSKPFQFKNTNFTQSEASDIVKPCLGGTFESLKAKNLVSSKDGWEFNPSSAFQNSSVQWIDEENPSKDTCKLNKVPVANALPEVTLESEQQRKTSTADTESHDDSWEDVTSGCESELSDPDGVVSQKSSTPAITENTFQDAQCLEQSFSHKIELNTFQEGHLNDTLIIELDSNLQDSLEINSSDNTNKICGEIDTMTSETTFPPVTSEIQFAPSCDDNVERILEEIYNDLIHGKTPQCSEQNVQEPTTAEPLIIHSEDSVNSTDCSGAFGNAEQGKCNDSLVNNTLNNVASDIPIQSSEMPYKNVNCDSAVADGIESNLQPPLSSICDAKISSGEISIVNDIYSDMLSSNAKDITTDPSIDAQSSNQQQLLEEALAPSTKQDEVQQIHHAQIVHEPAGVSLLANACSDLKEDYFQDDCIQFASSPVCDISTNCIAENKTVNNNCSFETTVPLVNADDSSSNASVISAVKSFEGDSNNQRKLDAVEESVKINIQNEVKSSVEIQKTYSDSSVAQSSNSQDKNITDTSTADSCDDSGVSESGENESMSEDDTEFTPEHTVIFKKINDIESNSIEIPNRSTSESSSIVSSMDSSEDRLLKNENSLNEHASIQEIGIDTEPVLEQQTLVQEFSNLEINNNDNTSQSSTTNSTDPEDPLPRTIDESSTTETKSCKVLDVQENDSEEVPSKDSFEVLDVQENNSEEVPSKGSSEVLDVQENDSEEVLSKDSSEVLDVQENDSEEVPSKDSSEVLDVQENDSEEVPSKDSSEILDVQENDSEEVPSKGSSEVLDVQENDSKEVPSKDSSEDCSVVNKNILNVQNYIKEDIDNELVNKCSSNINSDKQILVGDLSLDLENNGMSENVTTDPTNLEIVSRTVRKASVTESMTEFTEVLEVTTSIPRRIVLQDKEKGEHVTDCEIAKS